jgi:DNA replication protein DnaC
MRKARIDETPNYKTVDLERLDKANIGARYYTARLRDIPDGFSHKATLLDYVARLHLPHKDPKHCKSLLLHGPHGSGKTAAGSLILVEVMARSPAIVYFDLAAYVDRYAFDPKTETGDGQPLWRLMTRDAQFLVLDDLGSAKDSDWSSRWVEAVLTERYHRLLTTIITTNVDLDTLWERVPRLKHLSQEAYQTITFDGVPWRG